MCSHSFFNSTLKPYEQKLLCRFYADDMSAYGTQQEMNGTNIVPGIKPA